MRNLNGVGTVSESPATLLTNLTTAITVQVAKSTVGLVDIPKQATEFQNTMDFISFVTSHEIKRNLGGML